MFFACSASSAQRLGVDPGRGHVAADAVYRQQAKREQHALAQLGNSEDVLQTVLQHISGVRGLVVKRSGDHQLRQYFRFPAGGGNLLGRLAAELVRPHGQRLRDIATRQHLDRARGG